MSLRKQIKRAMARRVAQAGVKETMAYLDKLNTQAIAELTRAADLCPTTPLAEACRMAVEALRGDGEKPDCVNCRHADRMPGIYPCSECEQRYSGVPSMWEPKEG